MKRILLIVTLITLGAFTLKAQNELDALRYSQQGIYGNARFAAMSGAFGALGGEFSALSYNPAGISMYQFNELSFSPSFNLNSTTSSSDLLNINDYKLGLNISTLGLVYTLPKNNSEWKRINVGIGWNQLASYDRNIRIERSNDQTSLADKILELAQGNQINDLDNFYTGPAFWTDLIDLENNSIDTTLDPIWYTYDNGNYISHINGSSSKRQAKHFRSTGYQNEVLFSFGGSYGEKLYIGASIGLPTINYNERSIYSEDTFTDTINGLSSFNYNEELSVYGNGLNIKIGGIMRVSEYVKLGGAIHSPTIYNIEETYSTSITTYFSNPNQEFTESSPYNYFTYELISPWKAIASGSIVYNKSIIISGDYEVVDYSFTRMNSETYLEWSDENNQNIKDNYTQATNIRIGAEFNVKPFIIRGGYALYGSPYIDKNFSRENFSVGAGVNNGNSFFDIAYVISEATDEHKLYSEDLITPTSIKHKDYNLIFTLGFRY